jgi:chromosome segregation ATPase
MGVKTRAEQTLRDDTGGKDVSNPETLASLSAEDIKKIRERIRIWDKEMGDYAKDMQARANRIRDLRAKQEQLRNEHKQLSNQPGVDETRLNNLWTEIKNLSARIRDEQEKGAREMEEFKNLVATYAVATHLVMPVLLKPPPAPSEEPDAAGAEAKPVDRVPMWLTGQVAVVKKAHSQLDADGKELRTLLGDAEPRWKKLAESVDAARKDAKAFLLGGTAVAPGDPATAWRDAVRALKQLKEIATATEKEAKAAIEMLAKEAEQPGAMKAAQNALAVVRAIRGRTPTMHQAAETLLRVLSSARASDLAKKKGDELQTQFSNFYGQTDRLRNLVDTLKANLDRFQADKENVANCLAGMLAAAKGKLKDALAALLAQVNGLDSSAASAALAEAEKFLAESNTQMKEAATAVREATYEMTVWNKKAEVALWEDPEARAALPGGVKGNTIKQMSLEAMLALRSFGAAFKGIRQACLEDKARLAERLKAAKDAIENVGPQKVKEAEAARDAKMRQAAERDIGSIRKIQEADTKTEEVLNQTQGEAAEGESEAANVSSGPGE